MIDFQKDETRLALIEASDSKDGKFIIAFLKEIIAELDTNKIDRSKPREEVEIEFHAKSEARNCLLKALNILGIK